MISYDSIKKLSADLYDWSLKKIPEDTKSRLDEALKYETGENARKVLNFMIKSSKLAEEKERFLCSDAGVPVYSVKIGSQANFEGDIKISGIGLSDDVSNFDGIDEIKIVSPKVLFTFLCVKFELVDCPFKCNKLSRMLN